MLHCVDVHFGNLEHIKISSRSSKKNTNVDTRVKRKGRKYYKNADERNFLRFVCALKVEDELEISVYFSLIEKVLRNMIRKIVNRLNLMYLKNYYTKEDWENDILSYVISKLRNYETEKGRLFSYVSVIIVNYSISLNNKIYEDMVGKHKDFYSEKPENEDFEGLEKEELSYEIETPINYRVDFENFCEFFLKKDLSVYFNKEEQQIARGIALALKEDRDIITSDFLGVMHRMISEFNNTKYSRYKFLKIFKRMLSIFSENI